MLIQRPRPERVALPNGRAWYSGCDTPRSRRTGRAGPWPALNLQEAPYVDYRLDRAGTDRRSNRQGLDAGNDPGGFIVTILIGVVGAFLGGFLGNMIAGRGLDGFSAWSIILAIVGAMLLLWIYRMATRGRATPTP